MSDDKVIMDSQLLDFVQKIATWHHNGVTQLSHIINEPQATIALGKGTVVPPDTDLHSGIRIGVQTALDVLGTLPFEVTRTDNETEQ